MVNLFRVIQSYFFEINLFADSAASLKFIFKILPNTKVIWSQILPKLKWSRETTHAAVEKIRKRINKMEVIISDIRYSEIIEETRGLFHHDKVHLKNFDIDNFLYRIQQALQRAALHELNAEPCLQLHLFGA
ncbi:hypothetical protein KUTeg_013926 [Tegillarca granosa]|uniref:Uncharacterized protein n=1 Tax=Tegillarca granosa TaxID=220873 RepID=A0ABQ9EV44_TEGGR|nr:hypothetical protein KUTeg_013926 [Tegillarca granosa]